MTTHESIETDAGTSLPESDDPPRLDEVFSILQNSRRRLVLRYLVERAETTQGELAEHIAAVENGIDRAEVTSTQRKRVYISLYQSHLPKLDDANAIEFDDNRGTVERTPRTEDFWEYLERMDSPDTNRDESMAAVNLGCAAPLAGAASVGVFVELGVGSAGAGVALLTAVVGVAWVGLRVR
ncbi:MAG: hypothetical protein ABEJ68_05445 [Halobacteriaceae archaeon]